MPQQNSFDCQLLVSQDGRTLATAMHDYGNKTGSGAGIVVEQLPGDWWCESRDRKEES